MFNEYLAKLEEVAAVLDTLPSDPNASFFYEIMSDALIWRDEIPYRSGVRTEHHWAMRFLFHYRTCLILGKPNPECEPFWTLARRLAPHWPGFHEDRRSQDKAADYQRLKTAAFHKLPPGPPCPYCGKQLRTVQAKQCFACGTDWHDANSVVRRASDPTRGPTT